MKPNRLHRLHLRSVFPASSLAALATLAALAILAATPPLAAQQFGGSGAVAGDQILIGEPANQTLPGVVYVYSHGADGWTESARLSVSPLTDPPDGFGRAIAADGEVVVIGAPAWNGEAGQAFVYRLSPDGEWSEVARLAPEALAEGAQFGATVALSGDVALVAAPGDNDGAGRVYAFAQTENGWAPGGQAETGEATARLGMAMAFDGVTALVSAVATTGSQSEVHTFAIDASTAAVTPLGRLEPDIDLGERSGFGAALAVRGSLAMVGAPSSSMTGVVVAFEREDGAWNRSSVLRPFSSGVFDGFGTAVGFDGDAVWVGAPGAGERDGAVFRFEPDDNAGWGSVTRLGHDELQDGAAFGSSLALVGDLAMVGAGGIDSRAGGAVLMARGADGQWSAGELVIGENRGLPAIVGLEEEIPCVESDAAGYECNNVNIISFLPINEMAGGRGARLNDIWGWTDPKTGREIAIVGRTDGTAFVDLTDPHNPVMLGDLPKTPGSRSSVWRDMKVHADHAYIVADGAGAHGVQVFDLRRLPGVDGEPVTFEPDFLYDRVHSAHNIVINERTGFAYVVGSSGGGETCGGGLHMLDLVTPERPAFAGCFADTSTGRRGTGYSHDAQCVIYRGPDEAYEGHEICLGSNENRLSISDVTNKDNPVAISSIAYPNVAYAHQGWLTDDHGFFYMNDEGDEPQGLVEGTRTLIWDVEDLDEPILVGEYIAGTPDTDHNLYIKGDLMYQSNYGAGLRILDITNRAEPVEIAYFDNSPYGGASWSNYPYFESGIVVMTSTADGIFIVRNTARRNLIP